ncbi:MAG: short-chain dehydrogenase, partial [Gammaproteobacteria bacterium]|nr:short-chain dehydrogenase [Gammaproteobacteria bacterium]
KKDIKVNVLAPMARTRMTEELLGPMAKDLHPELVTPVVAFCASKECSVTGEVFSAGGGRVGRIFWGVTPGVHKAEISGEDIRDNIDTIMDTSEMIVASSPTDEMMMMAKAKA